MISLGMSSMERRCIGKMEEASVVNGLGVGRSVTCGNAWTVEVASSPATLSSDCGGTTSPPPPLQPLGALLLEPPLPSWALITGVTTARPRVVVLMKRVRKKRFLKVVENFLAGREEREREREEKKGKKESSNKYLFFVTNHVGVSRRRRRQRRRQGAILVRAAWERRLEGPP